MASATAVTAVGAVVGITGTGASTSNAQTVDTASSTTKLLDVPGTAQVQQVGDGVLQQADAQTAAYDEAQRFAAAEAARIQAEQQAAADKAAADKLAAEQAAVKAAADKAAADKAAADKKAAADRAAQQEAASRSETRTPVTTGDPKAIAQSMMDATQFTCFSNIVQKESGWKVTATNPSSGAYGLVQALPGSKMASAGADWRTNPATQIKWGLNYMNSRYGSPCQAWAFWQKNHWY